MSVTDEQRAAFKREQLNGMYATLCPEQHGIDPRLLRLALEAAWIKAGDRNTVGDHHEWLRRSKLFIAEYQRLEADQ